MLLLGNLAIFYKEIVLTSQFDHAFVAQFLIRVGTTFSDRKIKHLV